MMVQPIGHGLEFTSDPKIDVVLERNTDETGQRVLRLLGEFLLALFLTQSYAGSEQ